ncbi:MAG TPA: type IV secretory system conjugative DNA transfer family protein [Ktedonobacteraceae bacterium]|nr:type IV secretory system conjugative DNA transfer family protein [Ktedonobacteraceae bacterium]
MRWTRFAVGLLATGLLAYSLFAVYPFVLPLLLQHPRGWLVRLASDILQTKTATSEVYPYVVLGVGGAIYLLMVLDLKLRPSTVYGSAHFANWRESRLFVVPSWMWRGLCFLFGIVLWMIAKGLRLLLSVLFAAMHVHPQAGPSSVRNATPPSRFVIGRYHWRTIALSEQRQEEHLLLLGPNGSGKSSLFLIRNLLRERGSRSLFIADLKNELFQVTAGAVARYHQVWRFAPTQPDRSHGYNPLAHVKNVTDAELLARCWVGNTGKSQDPYWDESAELLITAIITHLRKVEPLAPFARVCELITTPSFAQLESLLSTSPSSVTRTKGALFLEYMKRNERLVGSIMTTIINRFQLFDCEGMTEVTATNEIDFEAMIGDPTALYLSIPLSETKLYQPLLACFTLQMFRAFEQRGVLPPGIGCYLDEFGNLGYIPDFERHISTVRYLHVAIIMAVQSRSQLVQIYGEHAAQTIIKNANVHLVLPGVGLDEAKYYSESIGDQTVRTEAQTTSEADGGTRTSWAQGETRRRLLTPDEIRTLQKGKVLLFPLASAPMIVQARPYYKDRKIARLANLPYHLVHQRQAPPVASNASAGQPNAPTQDQPIIVDADQDDKQGNDQFFLNE